MQEATQDATQSTTQEIVHEHSFSEWTVVKEAKCEEAGLQERVCTDETCGEKETEEIPALEHHVVEVIVKEASCEKEGLKEKICDICQKSFGEEEIIPATGHQWVEASCEAPKHCSVCNATEGEALEHNITSGRICAYCKKSSAELSTYEVNNITVGETYTISGGGYSVVVTILDIYFTVESAYTYYMNISYKIESIDPGLLTNDSYTWGDPPKLETGFNTYIYAFGQEWISSMNMFRIPTTVGTTDTIRQGFDTPYRIESVSYKVDWYLHD